MSSPPTYAFPEIIRRLKGRTASKLFEELDDLNKHYWGQLFGDKGYYFCATVG
ncbi:transposase (fragment) [Xenorhabdus nematophila str. Websteri]